MKRLFIAPCCLLATSVFVFSTVAQLASAQDLTEGVSVVSTTVLTQDQEDDEVSPSDIPVSQETPAEQENFSAPMTDGVVQPAIVQPGIQPGMMQPGVVQPGMMQPGMVLPHHGAPCHTGVIHQPCHQCCNECVNSHCCCYDRCHVTVRRCRPIIRPRLFMGLRRCR